MTDNSGMSAPTSGSTASQSAFNADRQTKLFLAAIILLFVVLRVWRLTSACLWFDEIFSIHAARHNWPELFRFVAADIIHPPLFYALLKIWIAIGGESLLWLRLLPALLAIASVAPFLLLCRELRTGPTVANLALLLMAVNGYLIKYAQEVRMYSLLMFLSIWSLWLFMKVFRREQTSNRHFFWLFLINVALVYSHYAGWLIVAVETLLLLIWKRQAIKRFFLGAVVAVLLYVPWLYLILSSSDFGKGLKQNIGWMKRPSVIDLVQFYSFLNKPFWFVQSTATQSRDLLTAVCALLLLGIPLLILLLRAWSTRSDVINSVRALSLVAVAPIAMVFILSWILSESVWGTRHLIIVAAPYSILVAIAVAELRQQWVRISIYAVAASWFVLAGATWAISRPPVYIWCTWAPLAQEVAIEQQQVVPPVPIYAFEDLIAYHLWFTLNLQHQNQFSINVVKNVSGVDEDPAYFLPRRFSDIAIVKANEITRNEIWMAYRAPTFDQTAPPLSAFIDMGYRVADTKLKQAQGQQAFMVHLVRIDK